MAGAASKNKGKSGERELCKMLESYFGGSFIRVPGSGAFIGGRNVVRKETLSDGQIRNSKADIITPDHMPKFVLESKFYADFPFHMFLTSKDVPLLDTWIGQQLDIVDPGDFWMVCFKINRKGWFGCIEYSADFTYRNHIRYKNYIVFNLKEFLEDNLTIINEKSK